MLGILTGPFQGLRVVQGQTLNPKAWCSIMSCGKRQVWHFFWPYSGSQMCIDFPVWVEGIDFTIGELPFSGGRLRESRFGRHLSEKEALR